MVVRLTGWIVRAFDKGKYIASNWNHRADRIRSGTPNNRFLFDVAINREHRMEISDEEIQRGIPIIPSEQSNARSWNVGASVLAIRGHPNATRFAT